ncbi:unnamed protein product [Chrysodeixis includens]|uniref:Uncharacterized protein n=1 Tax=Chrysodeixis includens TaxID=689277 RepID=A0A9N8Q086_CHRIL|nr:unnamed protein product [Chrysodeixis includens]
MCAGTTWRGCCPATQLRTPRERAAAGDGLGGLQAQNTDNLYGRVYGMWVANISDRVVALMLLPATERAGGVVSAPAPTCSGSARPGLQTDVAWEADAGAEAR